MQFLARARFPFSGDERARETFREQVGELFGRLHQLGHVVAREVSGYVDGALEVTVYAALPGSLAVDCFGPWVRASWDPVVARCQAPPSIAVIDEDAAGQVVDWREHTALYLFTHAFTDASLIRGGNDGAPIPVYLLPLCGPDRKMFHRWRISYRDLDRVSIDSGVLEIAAYRQLADPTSELCEYGRVLLCGVLERATGLPTYLYLQRYYGREGERETGRLCPGCGGAWGRMRGQGWGMAWFDFCCEGCRLVSHVAKTCEAGEEHAEIGEWAGETVVRG